MQGIIIRTKMRTADAILRSQKEGWGKCHNQVKTWFLYKVRIGDSTGSCSLELPLSCEAHCFRLSRTQPWGEEKHYIFIARIGAE